MSKNIHLNNSLSEDIESKVSDSNRLDNSYENENYTSYASAAAAAAVQMQYMQQQQMMMAPGNYLPFVMPPAYQMIIQQQQHQQQYLKNRYQQQQHQDNSSEESEESSPLNLHTSRDNQIQTLFQSHSNAINSNSNIHNTNTNNYVLNSSSASNGHNFNNDSSFLNFNSNCSSSQRLPNNLKNLACQASSSTEQKPDVPPPPKRPLTPYMRFSKFMWKQVKTDNPSLSVCEIGATIGRMWRELSNEEKQRHNDDFSTDKVRYDEELKQYLKDTGLRSRDLVKIRAKNKAVSKAAARRPMPQQLPSIQQIPHQSQGHHFNHHIDPSQNIPNSQFNQSFFPLGMPVSIFSGFPQMWAGQQCTNQQQVFASMQLAQQQSLYWNHQNADSNNQIGLNAETTPSVPQSSVYLY